MTHGAEINGYARLLELENQKLKEQIAKLQAEHDTLAVFVYPSTVEEFYNAIED